MSVQLAVSPAYRITCDAPGCNDCLEEGLSENYTRRKARMDGWQTRPPRGKGSRTAPDFCPEHAERESAQR